LSKKSSNLEPVVGLNRFWPAAQCPLYFENIRALEDLTE